MHKDLTQGSIAAHLRDLAIPAAIGFFFHTMFNVTDTYFAGKVSTDALAALSLTFPIFFMIISVGAGMSEAVTSLVGNALGEKNTGHAKQIVWHSFIVGLALSIVLSSIGVITAPILMQYLGATGNYLAVSLEYILTLLFASFFFIFSYYLNALLSSIGDLKSFRNVLIVAFFLNIFLDYWFVYGGLGIKPLGVKGIALATVITEALSMLYLGYKLKISILLQDMPEFTYDKNIIKEMIKQGVPPTVNLLLMAAGVFLITYFASTYSKEVVAGMGVGMRIEQIALMPALGISMAVLSVVSQNNGAKDFARINETISTSLKYAFYLSLIGIIALSFGAKFFVSLFTQDLHVIKEGVLYTRIAAVGLYGYIVIFIYISLLQGIQKPSMLIYISIARQIVLPIIVFSILIYLTLPVIYIWWALTAIVWASALFCVWYGRKMLLHVQTTNSI